MSTSNIWAAAGLGLLGIAVLGPSLRQAEPAAASPAERPAAVADSPAPGPGDSGGSGREIARSPDGHFYADAQVNGAHVRFMVDTGSSVVALTRADAQRAGIALPPDRARASGAGGEIEVIPITIERIALGPLEARDVRGAVVETLPVSLLGQSFLNRIGSVEIRADTMVLR